jgi:uncharacterized protein (TIGR02246 family)
MSSCASAKFSALVRMPDFRLHMIVILGAALFFSSHAHADTSKPACAKLTTVQVMQLMNFWKAGLASGSAEKMASFYTDDAVLVPTKDATPIKGREAIRAYYTDLLPRHPQPRFISTKISTDCGVATVKGAVIYQVTGKRKGTRELLGGHYKVDFVFHGNVWQITNQALATEPRKLGDPLASL